MANDIRQRRQSVDEAMDKLRVRLPDPLAKPPLHIHQAAQPGPRKHKEFTLSSTSLSVQQWICRCSRAETRTLMGCL